VADGHVLCISDTYALSAASTQQAICNLYVFAATTNVNAVAPAISNGKATHFHIIGTIQADAHAPLSFAASVRMPVAPDAPLAMNLDMTTHNANHVATLETIGGQRQPAIDDNFGIVAYTQAGTALLLDLKAIAAFSNDQSTILDFAPIEHRDVTIHNLTGLSLQINNAVVSRNIQEQAAQDE
jgi:hypothetical protein